MMDREEKGQVYLVGAGPGDPDLITLKGLKLLQTCDVVIYDRLIPSELLDHVKTDCERIYVGKSVGNHAINQDKINELIIAKALEAKTVVRLKGGDPFVFGRGGEEILALKARGIHYEVVPGITSAIAAAAYAGIPITHRGASQGFHVLTGHTADSEDSLPENVEVLAKLEGTLVILMGLGNLKNIVEKFIRHGKSCETPAAVIAQGTTSQQKEVRGNLGNIYQKVIDSNITSPAIIIIGKVADLDMRSTINNTLYGIKVGVTGTKELSDKLTNKLVELGAEVVTICSSQVVEYENNAELEKQLNSLEEFSWVVFTSSNSVSVFFHKLNELGIDLSRLTNIKFAVIGSGTEQTLIQYGFQSNYKPEQFNSEALAWGLCEVTKDYERILIPRALQGSEEFINILRKNNRIVEDIKIYDLKQHKVDATDIRISLSQVNYLTFASASGVHGFFETSKLNPIELSKLTKVVCIGEVTAKTLMEYGCDEVLIANEYSIHGLVDKIQEDAQKEHEVVK